jgi:ornithine decarboxylase
LKYKIRSDRSGPDVAWHAGPTCDSVDVVLRDEPMPSDPRGDFIYIGTARRTRFVRKPEFNVFRSPRCGSSVAA